MDSREDDLEIMADSIRQWCRKHADAMFDGLAQYAEKYCEENPDK